MLRRWRRLDEPGLEICRLVRTGSNWAATSCVTFGGEPSFALGYAWMLTPDWRTHSLRLDVMGAADRSLLIERAGPAAWRVDGQARPDLDGCDEVDVSATPFCNGLAIRRIGCDAGEITAAYVEVPDRSVTPSRQRYEKRGDRHWRYIDLGVARGFEADLELDDEGLVRRYQGLFEALQFIGKRSPAALFSDISLVAGGKKRGFCRLRRRVATPGLRFFSRP